jgi:hypothetical protein
LEHDKIISSRPLTLIQENSRKTAKQIPSGIKSKISYTPENGHVGRNM